MDIAESYKIGYVLRPHGLKGEVTVALDAEAPEDVDQIDAVFVVQNNQLIPFFVQSISLKGDKAYVKFEDVDSVEAAQKISKSAMHLPKSTRVKSGRGEFYDDEVIGFQVTDQEYGDLGTVTEVVQAGPNKLLSVINAEKEVLIPVNGPFITSVNKSKKKISVSLPDGFLEI